MFSPSRMIALPVRGLFDFLLNCVFNKMATGQIPSNPNSKVGICKNTFENNTYTVKPTHMCVCYNFLWEFPSYDIVRHGKLFPWESMPMGKIFLI